MSNSVSRRKFIVAGAATTVAAGLVAGGTNASAAPSVSGGEGTDGLSLIYCDDSGSPNDGYVVFSWVEVKPDKWSSALSSWMQHRKNLFTKYGVPPSARLHASDLIGGSGSPSVDDTFNRSGILRQALLEDSLVAIGENDSIEVGTVYQRTLQRGQGYQTAKANVYTKLLDSWDSKAAREERYRMVLLDGDGTDRTYLNAHRKLDPDTRRIIGDPIYQDAPSSQWTQMADLLAWAAYQGRRPNENKAYAWDWYNDFIVASKPEALARKM